MPQTVGKYDWFALHLDGSGARWIPNAADPSGNSYSEYPSSVKFYHHDSPNGDTGRFLRIYDAIIVEARIAEAIAELKQSLPDVKKLIAEAEERGKTKAVHALTTAANQTHNREIAEALRKVASELQTAPAAAPVS